MLKKAGTFAGIAAMVVIGLLVSSYLISRATGLVGMHYLPTSSMSPTLPKNSYVFTSIFPYWSGDPQRGDIITFSLKGQIYIERIIGLPGDHIQMRQGRVILNGRELAQKQLANWRQIDPGKSRTQKKLVYRAIRQYEEVLPSGKSHRIIDIRKNAALDDSPVYNVPADHYFVLGDNRDNSLDSRILSPVGYIPRQNIRGKFWTRSSFLETVGKLTSLLSF